MTLKTQVTKLIHTTISDTQLISARIPAVKINKIDELASEIGKTRTDLLESFIDGGIEELCSQLDALNNDTNIIEHEDSKSPGYFLLNTNSNNSLQDHIHMLDNQEASAFYSGWKENIERIKEGDVVFLYHSGNGICAYGVANGEVIIRDHEGNSNECYSIKLKHFHSEFGLITAKSCKDITNTKFNFRKVLSRLTKKQGKAIVNKVDKIAHRTWD
jgi:predicted DNA-binding protein